MPKSKYGSSKPNGYALFSRRIRAQNPGMGNEEAFQAARPVWEVGM